MDGQFADNSLQLPLEPEEPCHGLTCDPKSARLSPSSSSTPSPKRRRRSVQKRVVSIPIGDADGSRTKGISEGAPPADSWAWRKYGQKPIKGSPYPRGYYRCSSSKGCPARKQVERSRVDPTMLMVTYSCEHNHPWPLPKNSHHHHHNSFSKPVIKEDPDPIQPSPPETADPDDKFADLIGEESALMLPDNFWFSDMKSPSSTSPSAATDALLYGPIFGAAAELAPEECEKMGGGEEEDSLFAGLGELPEYSVVFRRSYLERQMAAASWCGSTG